MPSATVTLLSSAARTASGNTAAVSLAGANSGVKPTRLRAQLDVTAASGTAPTLDVVIEDTLDGTNWNTVTTFAQKTAAAREVVSVTAQFADSVRVRYTVGGTTPSFTFSVVAAIE